MSKNNQNKNTGQKKNEPSMEQPPSATQGEQKPPEDFESRSAEVEENIPRVPLAAPGPELEDRIAALERANIELERRLREHERYHFG